MTDKERIKRLYNIIENTFWMSIRYAHGRHTYAPYIIRDVFKELKEIFPDFKLKKDQTIEKPTKEELNQTGTLREDWLDDLFEEKNSERNKSSLHGRALHLKQSEGGKK